MKQYHFLITMLCISSCSNYDRYNKDKLLVSFPIENTELSVEIYRVAGFGVYGGDIESVYLTDGLKFRKFVGSKDDHQKILFTVDGDAIEGKKIEVGYTLHEKVVPEALIEVYKFDLSELKSQSVFE